MSGTRVVVSPRIRDMADQRLYRIDRAARYQHIEPLFSGTLNQDLILRRWDDLLRVAGSVKMGWVTASLLIGKLQSYRRQNALIRALQEYGRLIKTIHIVRCLDSPEYRRSIGRQLNKGEQLHNLGQSLWLDNITRDLLESGTLKRYIDEHSVTGLTSNPTIFDQAIKNSTAWTR